MEPLEWVAWGTQLQLGVGVDLSGCSTGKDALWQLGSRGLWHICTADQDASSAAKLAHQEHLPMLTSTFMPGDVFEVMFSLHLVCRGSRQDSEDLKIQDAVAYYDIWKYCQSSSKVQASVLQRLRVWRKPQAGQ